jgi:hypothetical protein
MKRSIELDIKPAGKRTTFIIRMHPVDFDRNLHYPMLGDKKPETDQRRNRHEKQ